MLSISHGLTGALIATKLGNPLLFVPLCFAAHYLEDWIPHWDVGTGLSNGSRKRSTAIIMECGELVITAGLVYLFWRQMGQTTLLLAGVGAFTALLPDFIEAPKNFLKWDPVFLRPLNDLHELFHHSTPNMVLGLAPQVAVIVAVFLLR